MGAAHFRGRILLDCFAKTDREGREKFAFICGAGCTAISFFFLYKT
jgi:hypothetical protein